MPVGHRPGSLRQENKKHKNNGHQSKRASKSALGAGRVTKESGGGKAGAKKAAEARKQNRANHASQLRKKKREDTWLQKRLGSDGGPPKLCAWVSLSATASPHDIQQGMLDMCALSSEPSTGVGMVSAAFNQFKQRVTFLSPGRDLASVLEFAKVADLLLVVLPVEQGADSAVDEVMMIAIYVLYLLMKLRASAECYVYQVPGILIQGASLRGRLPPKEVHGFRCKVATCKCQEPPGPPKQPGRRIYGRNRKDGKKQRCTGKPFAHRTSNNGIFVGRADFDFFVRFVLLYVIHTLDMLARANSVYCQRCRALIDAYLLCCLLRGLTALRCTVVCLRCLRYGGGRRYLMMLGDNMLLFKYVYTRICRTCKKSPAKTDDNGNAMFQVIFPNYAKKKPVEDTLVPPLWGTREENVFFL